MNVYDVTDGVLSTRTRSVIAESMGDAERIYKARFPAETVKGIYLHSEDVLGVEMEER